MSVRRACELVSLAESTYRYRSRRTEPRGLRSRLLELAAERPRFGYRRLHVLLVREGWAVNHKRIQRMYREERLMVRRKRRKRVASLPRRRREAPTECRIAVKDSTGKEDETWATLSDLPRPRGSLGVVTAKLTVDWYGREPWFSTGYGDLLFDAPQATISSFVDKEGE